jgi:hypothetical protein
MKPTDVRALTHAEVDAVSGGMISYHEEDPQNPKRPDGPKQTSGHSNMDLVQIAIYAGAMVVTAMGNAYGEPRPD